MDKIIEDQELLTIGKKTFDVSNVSLDRKEKAMIIFNNTIENMKENFDILKFNRMVDKQGVFLIRQNFSVLTRRMSFFKALKSYISRCLLTVKYIRNCNAKEYDEWQGWVYFKITGKKKEDLQVQDEMMQIAMNFYKEAKKKGLNLEQSQELLLILLQESDGHIRKLLASQKK